MTASCDTSHAITFSDWQLLSIGDFLPTQKLSETHVSMSQAFHARTRRCSTVVGAQVFDCEWAFEECYVDTYITLQSHDAELWVSVKSKPSHAPISERGWWEYSGDVRWAAWGIEHDTLISIFQNLLGVKLHPTTSITAPTTMEPCLNLCWRFISDNTKFEGTVLVGTAMLARLLANNLWDNKCLQKFRWQLQSTLSIEIPMGEIFVSDLAASGTGDLLLIENARSANDFVIVRLGSTDHYWVATPNHQRYTLCSGPLKRPMRKTLMVNEQHIPPSVFEENSTQQKSFLSIDQLTIQLALQLGEIEIPLGELEQLQPGYVLTLPHSPAHLKPTILANGQVIGRGELVTLGNQLGVRITEWKSNGL